MTRSIRFTLFAGVAMASLATSLAAPNPAAAAERRNAAAAERFYDADFIDMYDDVGPFLYTQCKVIDTISGQCLPFRSDSTWREGLPDFHGSNGG